MKRDRMFSRKLHIILHPALEYTRLTGEGLLISDLDAPRLRPVSSEGCLSCHACCDTGPRV